MNLTNVDGTLWIIASPDEMREWKLSINNALTNGVSHGSFISPDQGVQSVTLIRGEVHDLNEDFRDELERYIEDEGNQSPQ